MGKASSALPQDDRKTMLASQPSPLITSRWFPIDNASNLYALARRRRWNRVFRVAAVLDEPIDSDLMQQALTDAAKRFPSLCAKLRDGFFWCYLERTDETPMLKEEDALPFRPMPLTRTNQPNFRVQYYGCRISLEMFHAIADAPGSFQFLASIITRYYELKGAEVADYKAAFNCADSPTALETTDPYFETAVDCKARNPKQLETYYLREPSNKRYARVTHGVMHVSDLKAAAKPYGVTITEYLSAVIIKSYLDRAASPVTKPIRVSIPVNLRRRFDIVSARNFVYMFDIGFDPKGRTDVTFEEICNALKGQLQKKTEKENILAEISANVSAQKNPLSRRVPQPLKRLVLKNNYKKSQLSFTTFLSNYGVLELPDSVAPHVRRAEFVLGDTPYQPLGFACASIGDVLTLSVNANTPDMTMARLVFRFLTAAGVPVYIESNFHE